MRVVHADPPLIDEIDAAFGVRGKSVLFAWGDVIYAPHSNDPIRPELMAHEKVHGNRQLAFNGASPDCIIQWWRCYIADQQFRLAEEIPAHQAEYQYLITHNGRGNNAADRRIILSHVALRLRADLYRYKPKLELHAARRLIVPKAA